MMTIIKKTMLALMIVTGLFIVSQSVLKTQPHVKENDQVIPKVEVASVFPRYEFGNHSFGELSLLNNGEVWAVGYDGQHIQRMYHSKDRGKNWSDVEVPSNGFSFKSLSFSDSLNGWAVGGKGLIIRTTDGGKNWEKLKAPTHSELHAAHFFNSQVGYIAGREKFGDKVTDEVWGNMEILCTKSSGEEWRICYKEKKPSSVFRITTPSESEALIVLDGNRLIRTDNQGATWHLVDLHGKKVSSVALTRDGALWIVGNNGSFEHSDDRGRTWQHMRTFDVNANNTNWWDVAFNQAGAGIAVGESGLLAATLDSGKTWKMLDSNIRDHLRAVYLQDNYAIILGEKNIYTVTINASTQK